MATAGLTAIEQMPQHTLGEAASGDVVKHGTQRPARIILHHHDTVFALIDPLALHIARMAVRIRWGNFMLLLFVQKPVCSA